MSQQHPPNASSTKTTRKTVLSLGFLGFLSDPSTLSGQTLRSVVVLVGSCVLFVGALSTAAVVITSKAVGDSSSSSASSDRAHDTSASSPSPKGDSKKPLSI